MKPIKFLLLSFLMASFSVFTSCEPKEDPIDPDAGKPKVENLTLTPESGLKYGDNVKITANLSDEVGLRTYTIQMSNAAGTIYEKTEMLTGKTFDLDLDIPIPLPKNAVAGDMKVTLTVKNSGNQIASGEKTISNLALPVFSNLYLVISNTAYPMAKNGDVFEVEEFFAAGAVGKIYANADKTGLFWGMEGEEIIALGANDIVIGKEEEEFFKVSFDPISFTLTIGDSQTWSQITEGLYIYGNISGHWADGEISSEKAKMLMQGYALGGRKMWTWTAPSTGTGDPEDDMWGNIVPGQFRFKKAGVEEYITFDGTKIVTGADNKEKSFIISAGGPFTFRVFTDASGKVTMVRCEDGSKTLDYTNDGIFINGVKAVESMSFAGQALNIVPGNYFVYEGTMNLTKDQSVTSSGVSLSTAYCDPDAFTGKGNPTWTFIQATSEYYVLIDAFSGNIYIRNNKGYPEALYMDGWSWGKYPDDPKKVWDPNTRLTLYRVGTTNVYEAQAYIYTWGGNCRFFSAPAIEGTDYGKREFQPKHFESVELSDGIIALPVPAEHSYYKISVDVKDGFTWNTETMDGEYYTLIQTNNKKFTVTFTPL